MILRLPKSKPEPHVQRSAIEGLLRAVRRSLFCQLCFGCLCTAVVAHETHSGSVTSSRDGELDAEVVLLTAGAWKLHCLHSNYGVHVFAYREQLAICPNDIAKLRRFDRSATC